MTRLILIMLIEALGLISCRKSVNKYPPNILLILADDMGYSDISCYGGEINTPCLDRLAQNGIRFTQFYNTARCSPTRASLMTGLYPHETGVGRLTDWNAGPGYQGCLNDSCYTIPELLSENGYFTAMVGKWHIGNLHKAWPENRGYQQFFGIHNYVNSYFKVTQDCEVFENGTMVIESSESPKLYAEEGKEWYTTDVFTSKAIEFINIALEEEKPFFLYVAYNTPHWPLEAHDDVIEKYLDKYTEGYEDLRRIKYEQMQKLNLVSTDWELPEQTTPDWNLLTDSAKQDTRFRRAIYAAQIGIMDNNIDRLINYLEQRKIIDNTLVIFLSDNGCSAEPEKNFFGYQWGVNTKWNYQEWRKNSDRAGASQGLAWAITSNSPYRLYKKFCHEGGISTPLIMHWPEGIKNPGRMDNKPGHLVDIMSTCLDLAGVEYPLNRNGIPVKPLRGVSLVKNLAGKESPEHEYIFWEHEGHGALRKGKWKLVSINPKDPNTWELYDIDKDRTEIHDLSNEFPLLKKEMIKKWEQMAYETNAIPWPDFNNAKRILPEK